MVFILEQVENIVEKGGNAGYQHFLLFLQYFQKHFYTGSLKVRKGKSSFVLMQFDQSMLTVRYDC